MSKDHMSEKNRAQLQKAVDGLLDNVTLPETVSQREVFDALMALSNHFKLLSVEYADSNAGTLVLLKPILEGIPPAAFAEMISNEMNQRATEFYKAIGNYETLDTSAKLTYMATAYAIANQRKETE